MSCKTCIYSLRFYSAGVCVCVFLCCMFICFCLSWEYFELVLYIKSDALFRFGSFYYIDIEMNHSVQFHTKSYLVRVAVYMRFSHYVWINTFCYVVILDLRIFQQLLCGIWQHCEYNENGLQILFFSCLDLIKLLCLQVRNYEHEQLLFTLSENGWQ